MEYRSQYFEVFGEILEYGKIMLFQKIWEKFCRNVEVIKTWVTLGKKLKKYEKIFQKKKIYLKKKNPRLWYRYADLRI